MKKQFIKYSIMLFALLDVLRVYKGLHFIYFVTHALLLVFIIIAANDFLLKRIYIGRETFLLVLIFFLYPVYSLFTWLWSNYPSASLLRGLNTIFVTFGILSVVILWRNYVKENYFLILLPAAILVISTNVISLISGFPADAWSIGNGLGFAGLFNHQNMLATAILFTFPGLFFFLDEKFTGKKYKMLFYSLVVLNILMIILTYSRTSMLVVFFSFINFLIMKRLYRYLVIIGSAAGIVVILMFLIPKVNETIFFILEKQSGSVFGNRVVLWEPDLVAAKQGGFFGLGLGTGDLNKYYILDAPRVNDERKFYREKGNMFLAFIEETGLTGLILFLIPTVLVLKKLIKKSYKYPGYLFFIIIISYLLHSQFENWNGAGNTLMQFFLMYNFTGLFTAAEA